MSYVLKKRNNPDLQIRFTEDKAFKDLNKGVRNFLNLLVANAFNLDLATVAKAQLIDNETQNLSFNGKKMVTDLLLKFSDEFYINIEMNRYFSETSSIKNQDYIYRIILSKQECGKSYNSVIVYQLNIDDCYNPYDDDVVNEYLMTNPQTGKVLKNFPKVVYLSIAKLRKNKYNNCNNEVLARQLFMLNSNSIKLTKELAGDNEILCEAAKFMEEYSNDLENLMYVDEQEEKEKIYNSEMKEAYKNGELNGEIKGQIKGQIKGELKKTKETIKNATKMGFTLEQISGLVNLPINEILVIQNEISNNQD